MPDTQLRAIDEMARGTKRSRAALVRAAITDFLAKHSSTHPDDAFRLWSGIDGLAYQDRLRREWEA